ncbi:MAG: hypothetical protein R6V40_01275 [Candidatus Moraniibacteriota bacterium]
MKAQIQAQVLKGRVEFSSWAETVRDSLEEAGCKDYSLEQYCSKKDFRGNWLIRSFDGRVFRIKEKDLLELIHEMNEIRKKSLYLTKNSSLEGLLVRFVFYPNNKKRRKYRYAENIEIEDVYLQKTKDSYQSEAACF